MAIGENDMPWILPHDPGLTEAENDALAEAFFQIESSPDRIAGIVAAAFVEDRLTTALKSRLHQEEALLERMFRSSGPLGSFAAKIDLACLVGLCSKGAYQDLNAIRRIRNEFAHDVLASSFDCDRLRDLANSLTFGERIKITIAADQPEGREYVASPKEKPSTPRQRYIRACEMFVCCLPLFAKRLPPPPSALEF